MAAAAEKLAQLCSREERCLVVGESGAGSGKLIARAHRTTRAERAFVHVHLQTLPITAMEAALSEATTRASGGTLVLRCFDELPSELQQRALDRSNQHWLVATRYASYGGSHEHAGFREVVEVPPLRACMEDFDALCDACWREQQQQYEALGPLDDELREELRSSDWPGNVRQLFNHLAVAAYKRHKS
jgi:DNA-binding NtrC family response regulator